MGLNANQLLEIKLLLIKKKWYTKSFFNLFCEFIAGFQTDEEINLILKLSKDFLWIKYEKYLDYPLSHKAHELLHTKYFPKIK